MSSRHYTCLMLGAALVTLLTALLAAGPVLAQGGKGTGPADDAEELPVQISIRISWTNHDPAPSGNQLETGSMQATVTGTAYRLEPDRLFFAPRDGGMSARVKWKNVIRQKRSGKVDSTESGSGNIRIWAPADVEDPRTQGHFMLDAYTGNAARMRAMQLGGRVDPDAFQSAAVNRAEGSNLDNYTFSVTAPLKTKIKMADGGTIDGLRMAHFTLLGAALRTGSLRGAASWSSETLTPRVEYKNLQGIAYGPPRSGDVNYKVNWVIGKVPPEVRIFRLLEEDAIDITDELGEKKGGRGKEALVGERVRLKYVVRPQSLDSAGTGSGRWQIQGEIVKDWQADQESATLTPFTEYSHDEIEFVWVEGAFTGAERRLICNVQLPGETVAGEATILVYAPKVELDVKGPEIVEMGLAQDSGPPGAAPSEVWAQIFAYRKNAPLVGINASGELTMPGPFADRPHLRQFVQLVKENHWTRRGFYPGQEMGFEWFKSVTDDFDTGEFRYLDTRYPYSISPEHVLQDTPGLELRKSTVEAYGWHRFESYLMFLPSGDKDDPDCVWVPMKQITWGWKGACRRQGDIQRDMMAFKFDFEKGPWSVQPALQADSTKYPEWKDNIGETIWKDAAEEDFHGSGHTRFEYTPPEGE